MASAKHLLCFFYTLICLSIASACYSTGIPPNVSRTLLFNAQEAGGGWCWTAEDCMNRSKTSQGSSTNSPTSMEFGFILSKISSWNPEFCSWNRVYVHYCDGSSYTGDVESVTNNITYRGPRIFNAIVEDLLAKGMKNAQNAILSGSSAGGLATILHCDRFRSFLPPAARVKCLSDSGFFLHNIYLTGDKKFDDVFQGLIDLQGSAPMLPSSCIGKVFKPSLCFFPQYVLQSVTTPLFIVMSSFDQVQIKLNLSPEHDTCLVSNNCSLVEMTAIQGLRQELLDALPTRSSPSSRGIWMTSCITHEITVFSWAAPKMMRIANKTYPQVFADWFYDRSAIQVIDLSTEAKDCSEFGIVIKRPKEV